MSDHPRDAADRPDPGEAPMTRAFVGVIVVQVVTLVGLWIFQVYFGH